jgi:hypothetical protein
MCVGCALKSTRKSGKMPPRKAPSTGQEAGNTAQKGDDKGLTEDAVVLPESMQPRQSETSLRRSVK